MKTKKKEIVTIGIPCFSSVPPEVLDDYMRLAYNLGRREQEYDFFLAIKSKSEQFRARNAIVEAALQVDSQWLLMIDDDHIFERNYDLVGKLIRHLKEDPERGMVGALYAQRGGTKMPVIMKEYPAGPSFMLFEDLSWGLQMVDITGGGCMMINMDIFDKLESPWFSPEYEYGTDVQICRKVRGIGRTVWCDSSIRIGHLKSTLDVVEIEPVSSIEQELEFRSREFLESFQIDAVEYSGKTMNQLTIMGEKFKDGMEVLPEDGDLETYYKGLADFSFARNVAYHSVDYVHRHDLDFLGMFSQSTVGFGLDYFCGSAPLGFELALRGWKMDFHDVNDYCMDWIRWRAEKHQLSGVSTEISGGPYNFVLMMDAIEHMNPETCEEELGKLVDMLIVGGALITNYFQNRDYANPQHINMDKGSVRRMLVRLGLRAVTTQFWQKWR